MSSFADAIIRRSRALVGSPFRPQGRHPGTGLDCVGVILCAFNIPAEHVRRNYRLRGARACEIKAQLSRFFRRVSPTLRRRADVLLCRISLDQMHLAIDCGESFVHADARLRRIVETPGSPQWPVVGVFRRCATNPTTS